MGDSELTRVECLSCVGDGVLRVCMSFRGRGVEEREKERGREKEIGDRMGDDRLDLITGWKGWKGLWRSFLNHAFLCASWGRIHSYRRASARGTE